MLKLSPFPASQLAIFTRHRILLSICRDAQLHCNRSPWQLPTHTGEICGHLSEVSLSPNCDQYILRALPRCYKNDERCSPPQVSPPRPSSSIFALEYCNLHPLVHSRFPHTLTRRCSCIRPTATSTIPFPLTFTYADEKNKITPLPSPISQQPGIMISTLPAPHASGLMYLHGLPPPNTAPALPRSLWPGLHDHSFADSSLNERYDDREASKHAAVN